MKEVEKILKIKGKNKSDVETDLSLALRYTKAILEHKEIYDNSLNN